MKSINNSIFYRFTVVPAGFSLRIKSFNFDKYIAERADCLYLGTDKKKNVRDYTLEELELMNLDDKSIHEKFDFYKNTELFHLIKKNKVDRLVIDFSHLTFVVKNPDFFDLPDSIFNALHKILFRPNHKTYGISSEAHTLNFFSRGDLKRLGGKIKNISTTLLLNAFKDVFSTSYNTTDFLEGLDYEITLLHLLLKYFTDDYEIIFEKQEEENNSILIQDILYSSDNYWR